MKDYLNYTGDFSDLSRKDLEYLFILLENYKIRYRKNINVNIETDKYVKVKS